MELVIFKCPSSGVTYTTKTYSKIDFESIAESVPLLAPFYSVMSDSESLSVTSNNKTDGEILCPTTRHILAFYYLKEGLIEEGKALLRALKGEVDE